MNKIFIYALLSAGLLIGAFSSAAAQTETLKTTLKTYPKCQPANDRAVVSIAADGDWSLGGKKVEKTNLTSELVNYICEKLPEDRILYIRANAATPYGQITEIARLWRQLDVDQAVLMLDAQSSGIVRIPAAEPEPSTAKEKVAPLDLLVALGADGKLTLNAKPETVESLVKTLTKTFVTRRQKRIYRAGTREIEKTVFVYAEASVSFGAVLRLVKAIEKTGARPVGLDVDEYYLRIIF